MRKPLKRELGELGILSQVTFIQPAVTRISHWGFALSMTVVLITGFMLQQPSPFLAVKYGKLFVVHITYAWWALGFFLFRVANAIITKDSSILVKPRDIQDFPRLLAYYLFLRSTPPPAGKYNSGQKIIYTSWVILFVFGFVLGLASYWQGEHLIWVLKLFGDFQMIKWSKYVIAIYFSATIPLHIYLSLTEDLSRLQAIVTGYERKDPTKPK